MIIVTTRFRCDLCGKYATRGVTESQASNPTAVCNKCVGAAASLLIGDSTRGENGPVPRTPPSGIVTG